MSVSAALLVSVSALLVVLALAPSVAKSAETEAIGAVPDSLYTLPAIVVRASRITRVESDVFNRSGFVAVVDLGSRKDRVEDLSSVLSEMVGVRVRDYGGLGSFATVSIRGSSSNQVDVYLDGMPLADAYSGVSNLGDLPLGGIGSIEVYRGYSPPHLGSSSIGGVINLVTMEGSRGPAAAPGSQVEAHVSYGSFSTSRYALSAWPAFGTVKGFLHGNYQDTQGDFTFTDQKGTPQNPADDEEAVRVNNDSQTIDLLGRVEFESAAVGKLSLGNSTSLRENGVPGIGSDQSETARSERSRSSTYLTLDRTSFVSDRVSASASGYYTAANEHFRDLEGDIGLVRQDTDNRFWTYGGNVRSSIDLHPAKVELFWEGKSERFRPKSSIPTPTEGPDRTRTSFMTALSGDLLVDRANLVLTYTERFHSYTSEFYDPPRFPWLPPQPQGEVDGHSQTPQYGFRWLPTSFLTLKGNWGEHYRIPTFLELFGNTGSVTGSYDLAPERGVNRDIGATVTFDRLGACRSLFFEVVYLDNTVENLILFFPNSQFTSRPVNIGAARIKGWETSFSGLFRSWLRFAGNYTYLDGKDTGPIPYYNGNDLPGRPKHDLAASLELIPRWGSVSYEYHMVGANYLDPANQVLVPARHIHSASLRWDFAGRTMALTVEGQNLTNDQISDVSGFPLPGRSVFVTASYRR